MKAKVHCCSCIVLSINMIMSLYAFGYIFWLNIISAEVQMSSKMSLSIASLGQRILTLVFSLRVWMGSLEIFLNAPSGRFCQTEMEPWPLHLWVSTDIPLCRTSQSVCMLKCTHTKLPISLKQHYAGLIKSVKWKHCYVYLVKCCLRGPCD